MDRGGGLNVWGKDLCMPTKVYEEGVARPSSLDLYHLKWDIPQQAFKGGADVDAMILEWQTTRRFQG